MFHLNDHAPIGMLALESVEQFADKERFFSGRAMKDIGVGYEGLNIRLRLARKIGKEAAHDSGSDSEEVFAALPIAVLSGNQPDVGLAYEFSGLQGMAIPLAFHEIVSQLPQVRHDYLEELIFGLRAALPPSVQEFRDFA
jgi:hypothetical protein